MDKGLVSCNDFRIGLLVVVFIATLAKAQFCSSFQISSSAILSLLQNTPYFMGVRKHVTTSHDTAFGPPNGRG